MLVLDGKPCLSLDIPRHMYVYSKVVAERAAWGLADAQNRWRLVVVNPAFVIGPGVGSSHTSASFDLFLKMGDGTMRDAVPALWLGVVDVRDVAEAHFRAGFLPDATGRHIVSENNYSIGDVAEMLKAEFGDGFDFPRDTSFPNELPRYHSDNSKSETALGLTYRSPRVAAIAMFQQLIETGQLTPLASPR